MNTKMIFSLLTLLAMVATSACGTANPGETPIVETPVVETPEAPSIPLEDKPSLVFSESEESLLPKPGNLQPIIAYTFPASIAQDSPIAIRVAPYTRIEFNFGSMTAVGVVEIGPGTEAGGPEAGIYQVEINLDSGEGQLSPIKASQTYSVAFLRLKQIVNSARTESPFDQLNLKPPPDTAAAINADGVCFIIKMDDGISYVRYCSESGSILSVRTWFATKYNAMSDAISTLAANFDIAIQADQIISEMEHPEHLNGCSRAISEKADIQVLLQSCGSDIVVAPVTDEYFTDQYKLAKDQAAGGSFSVPVAIVQVFQEIKTSNGGKILPGNLLLQYWFKGNEVFFAADVIPLGKDNNLLQLVPAVPAMFVTEGQSPDLGQPRAQISTCRIFGVCTFFQSSCS